MKKLLNLFRIKSQSVEDTQPIQKRILVKEPVYPPGYNGKRPDFNDIQKHIQKQLDKTNKTNVVSRMISH